VGLSQILIGWETSFSARAVKLLIAE
jgi:hypothetical protein